MAADNRERSLGDTLSLTDRVVVITGGAGLMGARHAGAVAEVGAIPVLLDIDGAAAERKAREVHERAGTRALGLRCDITQPDDVRRALETTLATFNRVDALINNAAVDPKVGASGTVEAATRVERMPLADWDLQIGVGLTGAFLCSQAFGSHMADHGGGVILNIASDLGVIAPDQRIYKIDGVAAEQQPVKPITYSVVKTGLIGMTRYLATYWAAAGVRVNAISPGGVYTDQPDDFVARLTNLIPMGRMARLGEYDAAVVFLVSDASSYMTGANLVIDGGRTAW